MNKRYISILAVGLLLIGSQVISGCGGCAQDWSHTKSEFFGLHRRVTLYDGQGKVIRTWETRTKVEDQGGSFRIMVDGKAITVAGTIVAEEI